MTGASRRHQRSLRITSGCLLTAERTPCSPCALTPRAGGTIISGRPKRKQARRFHWTVETIRQHLVGEITVGLYAINPSTQRCKWVAIDADYKNALEDLLKLQYYLWQDKVEPALEMSKRGGHLWILLETPLLAKDCRIYIHDLATRLGVPLKGSGLGDGIEIFPRHNAIGDGEFGNAIRRPLGVHRGASRRYWFYGADYTLDAQMAYLNRLRKLTAEELQAFIAGKEMPVLASERRLDSMRVMERPGRTARSEFRILDHIGKLRRVGRNFVGRCPSCAETGHDRSADNLAILMQDPRFYKCWAGCTKEMIRAALGHPIRVRSKGERIGEPYSEKETVHRWHGAALVAAGATGAEGAWDICTVLCEPPLSAPGPALRGTGRGVRRRGG
jgi:hypothetical protein